MHLLYLFLIRSHLIFISSIFLIPQFHSLSHHTAFAQSPTALHQHVITAMACTLSYPGLQFILLFTVKSGNLVYSWTTPCLVSSPPHAVDASRFLRTAYKPSRPDSFLIQYLSHWGLAISGRTIQPCTPNHDCGHILPSVWTTPFQPLCGIPFAPRVGYFLDFQGLF